MSPSSLVNALYMKAIHGGKAKNDEIESRKIALLILSGMYPQAYVYPARMRATRDLLRRRNHLRRKRAGLLAHIQNTWSQYNLADPLGTIAKPQNRKGIEDRFEHPCVKKSISVDLQMVYAYDPIIDGLDRYITKVAQHHDPVALALLNTIPGVGQTLSLVI